MQAIDQFPVQGKYKQLQQSMDRLAAEAVQNGLTPEILDSILNDGLMRSSYEQRKS
jgi:hypothetical protein